MWNLGCEVQPQSWVQVFFCCVRVCTKPLFFGPGREHVQGPAGEVPVPGQTGAAVPGCPCCQGPGQGAGDPSRGSPVQTLIVEGLFPGMCVMAVNHNATPARSPPGGCPTLPAWASMSPFPEPTVGYFGRHAPPNHHSSLSHHPHRGHCSPPSHEGSLKPPHPPGCLCTDVSSQPSRKASP